MELLALKLSNSQEGVSPNVFSRLEFISPKMTTQTLKILKQMLQDLYCVSDHCGTLFTIGLRFS